MSSDHDDDLPGWISHSESDASSTDAEDDIPDLFIDTTTDTTSRRRNMLLRSEDGLATRHLAAKPVAPAWCEIVAAQQGNQNKIKRHIIMALERSPRRSLRSAQEPPPYGAPPAVRTSDPK